MKYILVLSLLMTSLGPGLVSFDTFAYPRAIKKEAKFLIEPSTEIKAIAEEAIVNSGLSDRKIRIQEDTRPDKDRSDSQQELLVLSPLLDKTKLMRDYKIAVAYHECGHLYFRHGTVLETIKNMLVYDFMKAPASWLGSYIILRQSMLNRAHNKLVMDALATVSTAVLYFDNVKTELYRVYRQNEVQADLFMCEQLYKLGNIEPLLAELYVHQQTSRLYSQGLLTKTYASEDKSILGFPLETHPSHKDRAAAIYEFLESKAIDVDQTLEVYLKKAMPNGEKE